MRSPFFVRALLLFAALLLTGLPGASKAQSSFTVSGIVQLEGLYTGLSSGPAYTIYDPVQTVVFIFTSTNPAQTTPTVFVRSAQIGTNGLFSLSNIPANSYTVWVYHNKWLAENVAVNTTNGNATGLNVILPAGDANNDNSVDSTDFGLLIGAYNTQASIPNAGYDETDDFNNDGFVDSTDFSLLIGNFNMQGAYPPSSAPQVGASVIMDFPAPDYGAEVVPMDGASGGGAVNLTSGVYENHPGADLDAFNPVGASPAYARTYHSGRASQGYGSPGLAPGWIDNYDYTIFAPALSGGWGPLVLIYPNGAMDTISPNLDAAHHPVSSTSAAAVLSGGAYLFTAPAQVPYFVTGSLRAATQGGAWDKLYVTFADNKQMVFSPVGGGLYRYTALVDLKHNPNINPVGRTLSINRDALGRVTTIANDNGAGQTLLQFQYAGNGGLTSLTDVAGLRAVYYGWANAQLRTVSQIAPSSQTMNNTASLWQYDYQVVNTWNLLKTITLPSPMPAAIAPPTVVMSYDGGGRVLQISDENSHVRQYAYNGAGATTVTVPTDSATPVNPLTAQIWTQMFSRNRDTGTSQTYLQAPGNTATVNSTTSLSYTADNPYLITDAKDANGAETKYAYDAQGNLASITEPLNDGLLTSLYQYRYDYNPLGWLTLIGESSNLNTGAAKTPITFDYYTTTTSAAPGGGAIIGLLGQIAAVHTPTPGTLFPGMQPGLTYPSAQQDYSPSQVTASFTYTALGNIASVTSPGPNSITAAAGIPNIVTTTFGYTSDTANYSASEALGEPLTVTSPFETVANSAGTRTQHYRYDRLGNLATSLSDSGKLRADYWYNVANQTTSTAAPALAQLNTVATRLTTAVNYAYPGGPALSVAYYAYPLDGVGMPDKQAQIPALRKITTSYGAAQEVKSIAGSTAPVNLSYDNAYQLTGLSDATHPASQFKYDGGGNLIKHTWPGAKFSSAAYDLNGNLKTTTNARGATTTLAKYSGDHTRVQNITHALPVGATFASVPDAALIYDDFGNVASLTETTTDPAAITTKFEYAYDDNNSVLSVITTYKAPVNGVATVPPGQQVVYTYNTDGTVGETQWYDVLPPHARLAPNKTNVMLASFTPAARKQQANQFPKIDITDPMSRGCFPKTDAQALKGINGQTFALLKSGYTYDSDGHLVDQAGDVVDTNSGICGPCLAASLTHSSGPGFRYLNGVLVAVNAFAAPTLPSFSNYVYDPLNNLKSYQASYPGYFKAGVNIGGANTSTTYTYDETHQRDRLLTEQRQFIDPIGGAAPKPDFNVSYAPDDADNLTTVRAQTFVYMGADNQITRDIANGTYSYDFDGNTMQAGNAAMTYDAANRMTSYDCGAVHLAFGYRPDGLRAWKQSGGVRTYYFYNGSRLQYEMTQQAGAWTMTRYFAWGAAGLYESWNPTDGGVGYVFDPQGSVVSRYTQTSGQWRDVRAYDAYGQEQDYDATADRSDPVGYNGQSGYYTDVASLAANGTQAAQPGLILCGHRYYAPDLARWLTRDPIGYEGGINVYAYCGNNPVGGVDPSGLISIRVWINSKTGHGVMDVYADAGDVGIHGEKLVAGALLATYQIGNITGNMKGDTNKSNINSPFPEGTWKIRFVKRRSDYPDLGISYGVGSIKIGQKSNKEIHGGRTGPYYPTNGCMRMDDDEWLYLADLLDANEGHNNTVSVSRGPFDLTPFSDILLQPQQQPIITLPNTGPIFPPIIFGSH